MFYCIYIIWSYDRLRQLSSIFKKNCDDEFYWRRKPEFLLEKIINMSQVTDKLDHIMLYGAHPAESRIQTLNFSGDWHRLQFDVNPTTDVPYDHGQLLRRFSMFQTIKNKIYPWQLSFFAGR